jgi:hypothetical protein
MPPTTGADAKPADAGDRLVSALDTLHGRPLVWHKIGYTHGSTYQAVIDWEKAPAGRELVHAHVSADEETRQAVTFSAAGKTLQLAAWFPDSDFPTAVAIAAVEAARAGLTAGGRSRFTWESISRKAMKLFVVGEFGSPIATPGPTAALLAVLLEEHGDSMAAMRGTPGVGYLPLATLRELTTVALANESLEHADDARRIHLTNAAGVRQAEPGLRARQ